MNATIENPETRLGEVPDQAAGQRTTTLPLTQQVATKLRDLIVQDKLKAGERIRERDLAERLAVSRTPLREALKMLATEGLIELSPHRGAVVADPDLEEIHDLLELLGGIEALAGELAATRASNREIDEIRALHYEMLAAYARKDRLEYFKANQAIHAAIVAACGNSAISDEHRRINARLYRVRYRSNLRNENWHTALDEHGEILEALEKRDSEKLSNILRSHLGSTWEKVSELSGSEPRQSKDSRTADGGP